MQPTLYLADTCSLSNAAMRDYWEHHFFSQHDRTLSVLFTVMSELKHRATTHPQAQAALAFLETHASAVEILPEQDGYPAGSVADCEIVYYCALWKDRSIVLYTEDQALTSAVRRVNPLAEVYRFPQSELPSTASPWYSVYRGVADNYDVFLTAACVNSPAFAKVMEEQDMAPLFRGKMILSTTSLPLLNEQGREILRRLEQRLLAPVLRLQGRICMTEREELSLRLLTHKGSPAAMLWLGETEESGSYLEQSQMQFSALDHKGYIVAILRDNGSLDVLQTEQAAPTEPTVPDTSADIPAPQPTVVAPEPAPAAALSEKEQIRQWILAGNIKKAGDKIAGNDDLMRHAVNTCFREDLRKLPSILQSLTQRKKTLPARCFAAYVSTFLPISAKELNQHFTEKSFVTALKRLIAMSASLNECQSAMDTLQKRLKLADEPTQKVLQTLINEAVKHGAPAPSKK